MGAVNSVSIGRTQTCVADDGGQVYCWQSRSTASRRVSRMGDIGDAVKVSVGDGTACVLHSDGGVSCWGHNDVGQVGDGTTVDRQQPVRLFRITDAVDISVSSGSPTVGAHACALHKDRFVVRVDPRTDPTIVIIRTTVSASISCRRHAGDV